MTCRSGDKAEGSGNIGGVDVIPIKYMCNDGKGCVRFVWSHKEGEIEGDGDAGGVGNGVTTAAVFHRSPLDPIILIV